MAGAITEETGATGAMTAMKEDSRTGETIPITIIIRAEEEVPILTALPGKTT